MKSYNSGVWPYAGRQRQHVPFDSVNGSVLGLAKPGCVLDERIENRLKIKRRTADDFQNFAGRRLLVQRFGEIAVAFLQFLEQPHVLDGDDGLVGEGLKQRHLLFGKRLDLRSTNGNHPNGPVPPAVAASQEMYECRRAPHVRAIREVLCLAPEGRECGLSCAVLKLGPEPDS